MIQQESQWIINKKKGLLEELLQLETKSAEVITQCAQQLKQEKLKNQTLSIKMCKIQNESSENQNQLQLQITQLEQIISKKLTLQEQYKTQVKSLQQSLKLAKNNNINMDEELSLLRRKLEKVQIEHQDFRLESERRNHEKLQQQKEEVQSLIAKYEKLIENRVLQLQGDYQSQIQTIKFNNQNLLAKIEEQGKNKYSQNSQELHRITRDYEKLIEENKRLLSTINDFKIKVINLESTIASLSQQITLAKKDSEYTSINLKREASMLGEENKDLQVKNRKLHDEVEELNWEIRELKIKHSDEIQKIKRHTQKEINECLENGLKSISQLEEKNHKLLSVNQNLQIDVVEKIKQINLMKDEVQRQKRKLVLKEEQNQQNVELVKVGRQHKKELLQRDQRIEILSQEIDRLKLKINKVTTAYHQINHNKDNLEKENKMLLSQIVFLRDKDKEKKRKNEWSRVLDDVKSDLSRSQANMAQEVQSYKNLIIEMEDDMQKALEKIQSKDKTLEKQKQIIIRLEKALQMK